MTTCDADGCERPRRRYGFCAMHSQRFVKYGTPDLPERERPVCAGPECTRTLDPIQNKTGLCLSHYKQRSLGKSLTPLKVATKSLGRPKVCVYPDCGRPHKARGYCKPHSEQLKAGRPLGPVQSRRLRGEPVPQCSADGCERDAICNTFCAKHNMSRVRRWVAYGITPAAGVEMYESQMGCCAICERPTAFDEMHVDHDHGCCKVRPCCGQCIRGLLCGNCNLGLGQFGDDAQRLAAAINYLTR